jgi:NAD(P)-dependent dehydrogenase (short-subunit alcohol dehydrogenase family)
VAAKSGLAGLTRNAAHAHRFDRVRINGLDIGWTDTPGEDATQRTFHGADDGWRAAAAARLPMGKLGQVDEIADFAVFLLSPRSGVGDRLGHRLGPERAGRTGLMRLEPR